MEISGSTIFAVGVMTWYIANPKVMVCATVKAVDCKIIGFNLGLSKKRLNTNKI
jgi:hypothetical protein